ncbi:CAP domain-containing protein, partial [Jiangella anatolica]
TEEPPEPEPEPTQVATPSPTNEPEPEDGVSDREQAVIDLTNEARADEGCGPLRADDRLHEAALGHSEDMADRDYFDHVTPEGVGPGERAERAGYDSWGGENIAAGYSSAEDVVKGWMDSPGHRANILNCDFVAIGVGAADSDSGPHWTQTFGYE